MSHNIKHLIKVMGFATAILFVCLLWIAENTKIISINALGLISKAVLGGNIIVSAYYYNFWKWNPFLEIPRFKENKGTVQYCYNENKGVKDVIVLIKQSPLSIDIAFTTNEIKSDSIIGNIVKENSQYILFYTYITTPSSQYSKDNPIQRGTCRLELIIKKRWKLIPYVDSMRGQYWTNRRTIGDLTLEVDKE